MDLNDLAYLMGGDLPEETSGPDWRGIWVVAERAEGGTSRTSRQVLGKARELGDRLGARVAVVLVGPGPEDHAEHLTKLGADTVYVLDDPLLGEFSGDRWVAALAQLVEAKKPEILLFGFTAIGREVAPRLAERLKTGLVADATELDIDESERLLVATRQSFGGRSFAAVTCPKARPQMATVRPNAFREADYDAYRSGDVETVSSDLGAVEARVRVVGTEPLPAEVPLERARVIVCAGEDVGGAEGVAAAKALAEALGGQLAGSRGAVEAGLVDASLEISARGASVAPELYVGLGVPGSIDHTDAMRQARTIVAVHANQDAALLELADVAVVGHPAEVASKLVEAVKAARAKRAAVGAR